MKIEQVHSVYLIGIGGIGMSALARYFKFIGKEIAGYDRTATPLTDELIRSGIPVCFKEYSDEIPEAFLNKENTLVVYTPAVPRTNELFKYFTQQNFHIKKRAEVLGMITVNTFCFAVAGTHGKTTTSSILAHLLHECGLPITAFLGGISEDFNSNFVMEGSRYTVVEADEFDRSFLHLSPDVACVTSMDADHLDIYGNEESLRETFVSFAGKLKKDGSLIVKSGLPLSGLTYGIDDDSDYRIQDLKIKNEAYIFTLVTPQDKIEEVVFCKPGKHNLLNGLAAFAMAAQVGISTDRLAKALATFKGVKRRFSYHIKSPGRVFIDDYAHHPTEINALYEAIKEMYPNEKVTAIFQPHLYSRTRDFIDGFARSLSRFDEIVLMDIYPAREKPIEGVTSAWLLEKIENTSKQLVSKQELLTVVKQVDSRIVVTLGAGDISEEVSGIKEALSA